MRLLAGLGNPGAKYERTRHNAGFWLVDRLAEQLPGSWKQFKDGLLFTTRVGEQPVLLYKPQQFMNTSGLGLRQVVDYYNLTTDQIMIAADDVYVAPGSARIRHSGGDGGHNGWKSVLTHLPDQEFWRIRLGAGLYEQAPEKRLTLPPMEDYVLQPMPKHEEKLVKELIDKLLPNLIQWLEHGELTEHTFHL